MRVGVPAEIRTESMPNTSLGRYFYTGLFGGNYNEDMERRPFDDGEH
jgi:hypothetical protein